MSLKLYNTLSKKKEVFEPLKPGQVSIYLCGPTVYDLLHIGNFRGAIFFNLLRNWLEKQGYHVTFVYNYTDVDDKIITKANQEKVDSSEVSERYIKEFEKDFKRLGLKPHDHNPKVTSYIPQIISFVQKLIDKGSAYVVDGEVFYQIDTFDEYGKLSGKKLEDLEAGQRVEVDQRKKNPFDFVLWKPSKNDEPSWDSPWGKGRPGWHIECSAMIQSLLGDSIDIHGGGIDLIFPHHENEIAQGEGCTGKTYCRYWVHNEFINLKGEKMSKSLGNVITGRSFMDTYHPEILKFLYLSVHYRTVLSMDEERVKGVMAGLSRIYQALEKAEILIQGATGEAEGDSEFFKKLEQFDRKIEKSLNDDINSGEFMASLFEATRLFNGLGLEKKAKDPATASTAKYFLKWIKDHGQLMALFQEKPTDFLTQLRDITLRLNNIDKKQVEELIEKRVIARQQKDWKQADAIRDQLDDMGILLIDNSQDHQRSWDVKFSHT